MKPTHNEDYYLRKLLKETKTEEIMSSPVIFIHVDAHFSKVAELLELHHIRHLPVVDKDDELIGLITQRDLYKIQSPRKKMDGTWYYDPATLDNIILRQVMTEKPYAIHPDDAVADAILPMVNQKYGCMPIIDKKNILCGIITQHDILKMAVETLKE